MASSGENVTRDTHSTIRWKPWHKNIIRGTEATDKKKFKFTTFHQKLENMYTVHMAGLIADIVSAWNKTYSLENTRARLCAICLFFFLFSFFLMKTIIHSGISFINVAYHSRLFIAAASFFVKDYIVMATRYLIYHFRYIRN